MPIFEYSCRVCGHEFEALMRPGSGAPACPSCQSQDLEKLLSIPAVKSGATHDMSMRAAKQRDQSASTRMVREHAEYEKEHRH